MMMMMTMMMMKATNLFDGALEPGSMLPSCHYHLSTTVIHVEVVHEQAKRFHISQARHTTHTTAHRVTQLNVSFSFV